MNPIETALEQGHDEESILNFISAKAPQFRKRISQAINAGYTARDVLNFIKGQTTSRTNFGNMSQQAIHGAKKEEDREKNIQLMKAGLGLAIGFGGGALAARGLPKIAQGASRLLAPKVATPKAAPTATAPTSAAPTLMTNPDGSIKITPEIVKDSLGTEGPNVLRKYAEGFLKSKGIPVPEKIKKEPSPLSRQNIIEDFDKALAAKQAKQALLPNGELGEIKEEKQGIATISTPQGERRRKIDEVVIEPEEAAAQALELVKSFTPEHERSSHHAVSFYDPDDQEAYFMFHNGTAYRVDDISPEEYDRLSKEVDMAKTTGKSPYGVWSTGEGSRGAAYHEIVKKLNKPYKKLHVGYNILKEWQRLINERTKREKRKTPQREGNV